MISACGDRSSSRESHLSLCVCICYSSSLLTSLLTLHFYTRRNINHDEVMSLHEEEEIRRNTSMLMNEREDSMATLSFVTKDSEVS